MVATDEIRNSKNKIKLDWRLNETDLFQPVKKFVEDYTRTRETAGAYEGKVRVNLAHRFPPNFLYAAKKPHKKHTGDSQTGDSQKVFITSSLFMCGENGDILYESTLKKYDCIIKDFFDHVAQVQPYAEEKMRFFVWVKASNYFEEPRYGKKIEGVPIGDHVKTRIRAVVYPCTSDILHRAYEDVDPRKNIRLTDDLLYSSRDERVAEVKEILWEYGKRFSDLGMKNVDRRCGDAMLSTLEDTILIYKIGVRSPDLKQWITFRVNQNKKPKIVTIQGTLPDLIQLMDSALEEMELLRRA